MSNIETLKLKDTKLINHICDLGDITIDKRRRWSIEFDDYGMSNVIDAIRADEHAKFKAAVIEAVHHLNSVIAAGGKLLFKDAVIKAIEEL